MKVCPNCGAKYEQVYYTFCKVCGAKLVDCDEPMESKTSSQDAVAGGAAAAAATTSESKASLSTGGTGSQGAQKQGAGSVVASAAGTMLHDATASLPGEITVVCDEKAVYLPGVMLALDNVAQFMFLADRPKFTWWMKALLIGGIVFWLIGGMGAGSDAFICGLFCFIAVVVAYFVRRFLAEKALIFAMNSGDKAKIISKNEKMLQQNSDSLIAAIVSHKPCAVTFSDAEFRMDLK